MIYACIYIPNFTVQAIQRAQPELRSCPFAVVDETAGLVMAANGAALRAGIKPGWSVQEAAHWVPIEMRSRSRAQEEAAHSALLDLGSSFSPRVEDRAADTIILDLAGLEKRLGSPEATAQQMRQRAAEWGFAARVAVAANPAAALHAARGFHSPAVIPPGEEKERLGSLPLEVLEPPAEMLATLHRWGVRTFRALASLPTASLSERLGQEGVRCQALARGGSFCPLIPAPPKLQFEEVMELDHPVDQLESLMLILGLLLNRLCARLAARAQAVAELLVDLELEAGQVQNPAPRIPASPEYKKRLRLPVPSLNSKALLKLLQLHLNAHPPAAAVVKVRIKAEAARPRAMQGGLFLPVFPNPEKLEITLARLGKIVGEENLGSPEWLDTHCPDAFQMARFNPFEKRGNGRQTRSQPAAGVTGGGGQTALRIFRPPRPARVEMRDESPVRVNFDGLRGEVLAAAGPWRTAGEWWTETPWQQDEWDVELAVGRRGIGGHGRKSTRTWTFVESALYRICRHLKSGGWFVTASYD